MSRLRLRVVLPLLVVLVSCAAKRAPDRITVLAPAGFSGTIRVTPCVNASPSDNISVDTFGAASTSRCTLSDDITVVVVRGSQSTPVSGHVVRTGDGLAAEVDAQIK